MRVIVTRVQPQAQQWAQALGAHGHDALALPLIETQGMADTCHPTGLAAPEPVPCGDVCQCPCGGPFL